MNGISLGSLCIVSWGPGHLGTKNISRPLKIFVYPTHPPDTHGEVPDAAEVGGAGEGAEDVIVDGVAVEDGVLAELLPGLVPGGGGLGRGVVEVVIPASHQLVVVRNAPRVE